MKLSGKSLWDVAWTYREVFYSASQFRRDDTESRGFVKLAKADDFGHKNEVDLLKRLNKDGRRHWTTSVPSTSLTGKGWDHEVEVPDFVE